MSADGKSYCCEYGKREAKCSICRNPIAKDKVRVGRYVQGRSFDSTLWHHLKCLLDQNCLSNPSEIQGFENLRWNDQQLIKEQMGIITTTKKLTGYEMLMIKSASKRKIIDEESERDNEKKVKLDENAERERTFETQSNLIWKLKDKLTESKLSDDEMRQLIEYNAQIVKVRGRAGLLSFLTDIMIFGPLEPCTQCGYQLVLDGDAYACTGYISSWTRCVFRTQQPNRSTKFEIPDAYLNRYSCLRDFKFQPRVRLFARTLDHISSSPITRKPCYRLYFTYCGELSRSSKQMRMVIEKHCGRFGDDINTHTVAVISSRAEVEYMSEKMQECQSLELHVVSEKFLDELEEPDILTRVNRSNIDELIMKHCICDWGSDLKQRMDDCGKAMEEQSKLRENNEMAKIEERKLSLKEGAVVNPLRDLKDQGKVLLEAYTSQPYSTVLVLVDRNKNAAYNIKIFELDKPKRWILLRSWGRVGNADSSKLENFYSKDSVIQAFEKLFLDKTGNNWSHRDRLVKRPGKYYPIELDHDSAQVDTSAPNRLNVKDFESKSTLPKPIQNIIKMIFDIEKLERQMREFDIDLKKMPLGKISKNQIRQAFDVLNELSLLILSRAADVRFLDACNRFYTLIPHDFGLKSPPLLKEADKIKEKIEMLNSLLDIDIAFNMLKMNKDQSEDLIDTHYKNLHCGMEVLDKESNEFKLIERYLNNTHAETHNQYRLVIKDVIKVNREGESEKYEKKKQLKNRKLLWHGSRVTNFAGILSQGLRIAPPEAPPSGYMFGKGVYFADMVSKSANYCFASRESPSALILLCEVALGNQYERKSAEYVKKLPKNKHSTKGIGQTMPDPRETHVTEDGVEIPLGRGVYSRKSKTNLLYNEYIVYDTSQVQMKYLINVEFEFN